MADATQPPPPPPPPPGEVYSAPRGEIPASLESDPYFRAGPTQVPGYQPGPASAPTPESRSLSLFVALAVGLAAAVGGYFLVKTFFLDAKPPSPEEVAAAFVPVEGATYQEPPGGTIDQLRPLIDQANELSGEDYKVEVFDLRALLVNGQPEAVVVILGIDPDAMAGDFEQGYLAGFNAASQQQLVPTQVGNVNAHAGQLGAIGRFYTFFDPDDGMVFLVMGRQQALLERTVTALGADA